MLNEIQFSDFKVNLVIEIEYRGEKYAAYAAIDPIELDNLSYWEERSEIIRECAVSTLKLINNTKQ